MPLPFAIGGGKTDASGNPGFVAATSTKVAVSRLKLDHFKQAAFVVSKFTFNTNGYSGVYVSANRTPTLKIQLTGDLRLNIRF